MRRAGAVGVLALVLAALTACTSASAPSPDPSASRPSGTFSATVVPLDPVGADGVAQDFLNLVRAGRYEPARALLDFRLTTAQFRRVARALRSRATFTYDAWSNSTDQLTAVGNIVARAGPRMPSGSVWSCTFHLTAIQQITGAYCIGFGADDRPNGQTLFRLPVR